MMEITKSLKVDLKRQPGNRNLGFTIVGGSDSPTIEKGIFVKSVVTGGLASRDGRLQMGDEITHLNGISLHRMTHVEVLDVFKKANNEDLVLSINRRRTSPFNDGNSNILKNNFMPGEDSKKMKRETLFDLLMEHKSTSPERNIQTTSDVSDVPSTSTHNNPPHNHLNPPVDDSDGLRRFVVHRLPGESLGLEIDIKRFLGCDSPIHGVIINHVVPGSAADKSSSSGRGVRVGDEIVSINGTRLRSVTHSEAMQMFDEMPLRVELLIKSNHVNDLNNNISNNFGFGKSSNQHRKSKHVEINKNENQREDSRSFIRGSISRNKFQIHDLKHEEKNEKANECNFSGGIDMSENEHKDSYSFFEDIHHPSHPSSSNYVLQTRQPSIKHEGFELRKFAFKKRMQEELGIQVESCFEEPHHYLKVIGIHPTSVLARHNLVETGDLLVSYNGLPLKNAAKSKFDSILSDRGVVLEDVCIEILRDKMLNNQSRSVYDLEDVINEELNKSNTRQCVVSEDADSRTEASDGDGILDSVFVQSDETRTPSPTKPMRTTLSVTDLLDSRIKCVSRDSGMIDDDEGGRWSPGPESDVDGSSRATSPRSGAYYFEGHLREDGDHGEGVSLINFNKLPIEQEQHNEPNHKKLDGLETCPTTCKHSTFDWHSFPRTAESSANNLNNSGSNCFSLFEANKTDVSPANIMDRVQRGSTGFDHPNQQNRHTLTQMRGVSSFSQTDSLSVNIPNPRSNQYNYLTIQSEKFEMTEVKTDDRLVTSIDDEIMNEIQGNIKESHEDHHFVVEPKVPPTNICKENASDKPTIYYENIGPTQLRRFFNFVNKLLQNAEKVSELPSTRSNNDLFRVNFSQSIFGLGMKLKLTSFGGVVEEIDRGGPVGRNGEMRVGDCVLSINNTPLGTMASDKDLQNFVGSLPLAPVRFVVSENPVIVANCIPLYQDALIPTRDTTVMYDENKPQVSTTLEETHKNDLLELEFVITNRPVDLGLGHIAEIIGVNTPYTTVIYSEKREEFATFEDMECFFKKENLQMQSYEKQKSDEKLKVSQNKSDSGDSFDDDILLDGTRFGFVSRIDSFKRKFKNPQTFSIKS